MVGMKKTQSCQSWGIYVNFWSKLILGSGVCERDLGLGILLYVGSFDHKVSHNVCHNEGYWTLIISLLFYSVYPSCGVYLYLTRN